MNSSGGAGDDAPPRVAVIGIGNLLLTDEGIGVHAVRALDAGGDRDDHVLVIDGGTDPWTALSVATGCRALLLLDALHGDKAPGAFYRLALHEVEPAEAVMSLHGISLFHLLHYGRLLGNGFQAVHVLGMEPASLAPGLELSQCCRRRLPAFVDMVRAEICSVQQWLASRRGEEHAGHRA